MGIGWIQLASGNGYDFETGEIFGPFAMEKDVAGPLAGEARYVSHTDKRWDVAIHSVLVARVIETVIGDKEAAAAGLMHDCHEAVIGDIPTPVARYLDYEKVKLLKDTIHSEMLCRLGLPQWMMPHSLWEYAIEMADRAALLVEKQLFMAPEPRDWGVPHPPHIWMLQTYAEIKRLSHGGPAEAYRSKELFVEEYRRLCLPVAVEYAAEVVPF